MGHAKVELVVDRLPKDTQKIIFYIVDAISFYSLHLF
jgi:TRAP-type C4-dicarboxylate transport system permease small subunit